MFWTSVCRPISEINKLKVVFLGTECRVSVDAVFVLDISGSAYDTHLLSRDLAAGVIYGLDVRSGAARVGVVAYSSRVVGQTFLGEHVGDREAIVNALRLYRAGRGSSNTAAALDAVRTQQLVATRGARTAAHKARRFFLIFSGTMVVLDYT